MIKIALIRKLRLKKGCKYIIFFPKSTGISAEDLERIDYHWIDFSFLVEDTKGIKIIEVKKDDKIT